MASDWDGPAGRTSSGRLTADDGDRHAAYVDRYGTAIEEGLGTSLAEPGEAHAVPIVVTPESGRAW